MSKAYKAICPGTHASACGEGSVLWNGLKWRSSYIYRVAVTPSDLRTAQDAASLSHLLVKAPLKHRRHAEMRPHLDGGGVGGLSGGQLAAHEGQLMPGSFLGSCGLPARSFHL